MKAVGTVTKPLEDIINTVSGIQELRSISNEGVSVVTVQFVLSKNGDVGVQEVRDKVNLITGVVWTPNAAAIAPLARATTPLDCACRSSTTTRRPS